MASVAAKRNASATGGRKKNPADDVSAANSDSDEDLPLVGVGGKPPTRAAIAAAKEAAVAKKKLDAAVAAAKIDVAKRANYTVDGKKVRRSERNRVEIQRYENFVPKTSKTGADFSSAEHRTNGHFDKNNSESNDDTNEEEAEEEAEEEEEEEDEEESNNDAAEHQTQQSSEPTEVASDGSGSSRSSNSSSNGGSEGGKDNESSNGEEEDNNPASVHFSQQQQQQPAATSAQFLLEMNESDNIVGNTWISSDSCASGPHAIIHGLIESLNAIHSDHITHEDLDSLCGQLPPIRNLEYPNSRDFYDPQDRKARILRIMGVLHGSVSALALRGLSPDAVYSNGLLRADPSSGSIIYNNAPI